VRSNGKKRKRGYGVLKREGDWREGDTIKKGKIERRNGQKGGCNDRKRY
jgi:hypothetical protein